ncbi:MAG TPA: sialidase family protein [Pyrinomonadaceae bacterium]|nr:sialidase family protein [Pyrinomonadaceae bacterium]
MIRSGFTYLFIALILISVGCAKTADKPSADSKTNPDTGSAIRISADGIDAAEPAIAADAQGNVFVVFVEHSGKAADVFVQKLDANGKVADEKVRVNPAAGEAKAWKGDPPTIAVAKDNTIYIGWTRKLADEKAKGNDLMLSASRDGGRTFGEPAKVNDDTKPASHGMHSLAVDSMGVYVAWLDERNIVTQTHDMEKMGAAMAHHEDTEPNSEVFYSYSNDGGKTFFGNKKIASDVCPCCKTTLLIADNGTVYAAWRQVLKGDHRHIAVARSTVMSTGGDLVFNDAVIVSDDNWQINACPVSGAALTANGETLDVMWYTAGAAGQAGMYFARSADGGKTFGPRLLVSNEATSGTPVLVQQGAKAVAVFADVSGGLLTAKWEGDPASKTSQTKTADANLPASVSLKGKIFTAFVRNSGGKNSIWVTIAE